MTLNSSKLLLLFFYFSLIIVTATSSDHDLHNTIQEKDNHIAQLNHELEIITREKEDIITTLQTKLQEYKQQLLKTTG